MKHAPAAIAAIAFDLDGTLIDSAPDIAHALDQALTAEGLQRFDVDLVRSWVGDGPDVLIGRALATQGRGGPDSDLRVRLRRSFDAATRAAPLDRGTVYPGIRALLEALRGRMPLCVATNKPTELARVVLHAAGLLELMGSVHGADRPSLRKPRPDLLLQIARQLGISPDALLMVGDGPTDIDAARAAGCPAALVSWGYARKAVADSPEFLHLSTPSSLVEALCRRGPFNADPGRRRPPC